MALLNRSKDNCYNLANSHLSSAILQIANKSDKYCVNEWEINIQIKASLEDYIFLEWVCTVYTSTQF